MHQRAEKVGVAPDARFIVWIVERPRLPPEDVGRAAPMALRPLSQKRRKYQAAALVAEGFNREMLARHGDYWAIPLPAAAEPRRKRARRIKNPPRACQKSALDGSPPREFF